MPNKLKAVEEEVHNLDLQARSRKLDQHEKARRRAASEEVWRFHRMMEWTRLQKSRLNWNLKGDRNTRFFHVMAKGRQCRNEITSIAYGGSVLEEPSLVKSAVFEHFKKQYSEEWVSRPKLGGFFTSVSNSPYFDMLETEFSESKILAVVKDCEGNKALGPDGFNMLYFQKFWKLMKGEVFNFMKEFYRNGRLVKGLNSSFITLVPKKENLVGLSDYKNILGGVLIANEVVDGWKKSKKKGVIIKIDFEKAYDSVNWGFLNSMLLKFGFRLR